MRPRPYRQAYCIAAACPLESTTLRSPSAEVERREQLGDAR